MLTANETNNNQYYFISFIANLMKSINVNKTTYIICAAQVSLDAVHYY